MLRHLERAAFGAWLFCLCAQTTVASTTPEQARFLVPQPSPKDFCPQFPALFPQKHRDLDTALENVYITDAFGLSVASALGAIVRVPTETHDDMGPVGEDPRWRVFETLHSELRKLFPLIFEKLYPERINSYALAIRWQGTDKAKQPILLAAHLDVVPVDPSSVNDWLYAPYSGHYDGTWVWGRGTCDDKSDLATILITVETLLKHGFVPSRSIVLAFGFDEESFLGQGAPHIAKYLEAQYGNNSFAAILDEGDPFNQSYGGNVIFANPAVTEKGYMDLRIEVTTLGGHSSVPPRHTAIGILATAITQLEAYPSETALRRSGTPFQSIQCAAAYGPDVPDDVRFLAWAALEDDEALAELERAVLLWKPETVAELGTTQAVDVIAGGVKLNALPEAAFTLVDHRIAEHSSVPELQAHVVHVLEPVARRLDVTLEAFGVNVTTGDRGRMSLSVAFEAALEPAPITPTTGSPPYAILAGTILAALEGSSYNNSTVVVQPTLGVGNTDTKDYWNLSRHIFRYKHMHVDSFYNGVHTINEAVRLTSLVEKIGFYTKFILNWDEAQV